jgi:murein DD-endopeptidase MepM/ murein hydrolase activator NlpD
LHARPGATGRARLALGAGALALLGACADLDLDMRDLGRSGLDTSEAALSAVESRPAPDNRGVISYPGYQVAVARRGDTVADVAARIGLPADELARFNGAPAAAPLNPGEVLALPRRVAEPSPATGAPATGPIRPPGEVDVTALAGAAIERAEGPISRSEPAPRAAPQTGTEPRRHRVAQGETAFTIARRYNVPVAALAEWNGLDSDYTLRQGQYLLIPPASAAPERTAAAPTTAPGTGSPTPTPPSAAAPLPEDTPPAAAADDPEAPGVDVPDSPNLAEDRTAASGGDARFLMPVSGPIIRDFAAGRNEGIDIAADAGTPVRAAEGGTVAAITRDTEGVPIVVVRHAQGLLTVYAGVDDLTVARGDSVSRGQTIARVRAGEPSFLHFEVRQGVEAVDPGDYID